MGRSEFGEGMAGDAASGRGGDGVDGVFAFGRADGELLVFQISQEIRSRGSIGVRFLVLEGPLLFGDVNQAEVAEAAVFLSGRTGFGKGGESHSRNDCDRNDGGGQK